MTKQCKGPNVSTADASLASPNPNCLNSNITVGRNHSEVSVGQINLWTSERIPAFYPPDVIASAVGAVALLSHGDPGQLSR